MTGKSNKSKNAKKKEPVRIESITLKNAACFENITIPFKERISVLVGPNGTGKTTVLNTLVGVIIYAWVKENYPQEQNRLNRLLPLSKSTAPKSTHYFSPITITSNKSKFNYEFQDRNVFNKSPGMWGHHATPSALSELLKIPIIPISGFRKPEDEVIKGVRPLYGREANGSKNADAFPNPNEDSQFLIEYIDLLIKNLEEFRAHNMKQWIFNMYFFRNEEWADKERNQFVHFTKNLSSLLPCNEKIEFLTINKDLEPMFKTITGEVPFGAFSSGFQSILSIYWNILYFLQGFYPDSPNPFEESGIAIIDELDAHLHPEWQQVILNGLREMFPNVQFIMATHSPLIVSGCKPGEAIFLKYDKETKSVIMDESAPQNTQGWLSDVLLTQAFKLESSREKTWADKIEKLRKIISNMYLDGISEKNLEYIRELQKVLNLPSSDPIARLLDEETIEEIMEDLNAQN